MTRTPASPGARRPRCTRRCEQGPLVQRAILRHYPGGTAFEQEVVIRFPVAIGLTLLMSAVGLTYEIAAGRVLAPFFGTSLLTWTTVIATVLGGFSLGSALGGLVAERPRDRALRDVRKALVATAVLMSLSPTLLGALHAWGARGTGGMILSVLVVFFPASVFITLPSPLLARLAIEARPGHEGSSLGFVMAAGSIGAIFGSVLAGFVALPLIGATATFAACGLLALACLPFLRGGGGGPANPGVTVATLGFIAFAGLAGSPACQYESGQSCLDIDERGPQVRLFSDGILQAAEYRGAQDEQPDGAEGPEAQKRAGTLALPYTDWLWSRLDADLGPAPSVLFIGGGGYTLPTKLLATRPAARALAVEIDPLVTEVVRAHLPRAAAMIAATGYDAAARDRPANGRLGILHADGRAYLTETGDRFDAAVMDAFSSRSVPAHLVTRETYLRLREVVDGPVYVNLIDRPDGPLARGVHAILTQVYPHVLAVMGPLSPSGRANILLAAAETPLTPLAARPDGYHPTRISPARAFTDDRGWVGHR